MVAPGAWGPRPDPPTERGRLGEGGVGGEPRPSVRQRLGGRRHQKGDQQEPFDEFPL